MTSASALASGVLKWKRYVTGSPPPGFFSKILSMTFGELSGVFCRSVRTPRSVKHAKGRGYISGMGGWPRVDTDILVMFSTGRVIVGGPFPGAGAQRIVFWSAERERIPSFFLNAARPEGL